MRFWLIALMCGFAQTLQAMTNGAAARSGVGAIWVGAMSASVSALTMLTLALLVYRLPFPGPDLLASEGWKTIIGGLLGATLVTGFAFVTPKLGPTQTFILFFTAIAIGSALIDNFGLLGAEARPLGLRQLSGVALAGLGLILARS